MPGALGAGSTERTQKMALPALASIAALALAAHSCTDGMDVKDIIGYMIDGNIVSNTKLEAVRWRRFESLLGERGVRSRVGIASCGNLRGLRAIVNTTRGELLLHIPKRLILDEAYLDGSDVAPLWKAAPLDEPRLPLHVKFALLVLHEDRLGDDAMLQPYVQLLPTADDMAQDGDPAWVWTAEERAVTECARLMEEGAATRAAHETLPALAQSTLAERWHAQGMPGRPPSRDELAWAVAVVTTRWVTNAQPHPTPIIIPAPAITPSFITITSLVHRWAPASCHSMRWPTTAPWPTLATASRVTARLQWLRRRALMRVWEPVHAHMYWRASIHVMGACSCAYELRLAHRMNGCLCILKVEACAHVQS